VGIRSELGVEGRKSVAWAETVIAALPGRDNSVVGEFCHVRRVVEGPARPAPRMPRLAADRCGLDPVYAERRATVFSGTGERTAPTGGRVK
jgi:hypothetical protein